MIVIKLNCSIKFLECEMNFNISLLAFNGRSRGGNDLMSQICQAMPSGLVNKFTESSFEVRPLSLTWGSDI